MYLSDLKELVASLAVITTILQFLSGTLVCRQYVINGTTSESSPLPFICGFISSGLWFLYGLTKQDNKIILVNIVGIILMLSYIIVFYSYTFKKSSVLKQLLVSLTVYAFTIGYMSVEEDNERLLGRLGFSACSFTLLTVAAPMSKLLYIIRTKCTDCLPFPMIFMSLIVSSLWFLYGVIEEDIYLSVPNFIAGALACAQLSLFVIYPSAPPSPLLSKTTLA
ncbi:sugar transporter SWEET1 [Melitaea cinxia]|uniref:sugar transporter SWEET1 n=1 Tax=Melitaea cinxia TaxID=113334 RepID=UPI0004EA940F|nr:sugar transporter SWEET1 [Melitaea cinxia]